jgi:hypothetical protein
MDLGLRLSGDARGQEPRGPAELSYIAARWHLPPMRPPPTRQSWISSCSPCWVMAGWVYFASRTVLALLGA